MRQVVTVQGVTPHQ